MADANPTEKLQGAVAVKDALNAPIVYFDGAPNFGCNSGIVNVTLAAARHLLNNGNVETDVVAVAFLRCSVPAAISLRDALNGALLLGAPTAGGNKAN